jgi:hypothetical protein
MLTGEARDGKQKRKISRGIREIWKIYFIPEGANVSDTIFTHASEEKSVAVWDAFLKKTNGYRGGEANSLMRDALMVCAQSNLVDFQKGKYTSIEKARLKAERARSVRDEEDIQQLLRTITQEKQKVDAQRKQVELLLTERRWDDAITAAESIKAYLSGWLELKTIYTQALKESHDLHLSRGEDALRTNQLDVAKTDCSLAWQRLPDSDAARSCVCQSRTRITLRDSRTLRQQRKPKEAKELLEKQLRDTDCNRDDTIAKELADAKREYSDQLVAEARQLIPNANVAKPPAANVPKTNKAGTRAAAPKPVAAKSVAASPGSNALQIRANYRDARTKLLLARENADSEEIHGLLEIVNQKLSDYCTAEARKAMQRGDYGTAYVFLRSAQDYTPNDSDVLGLLDNARTQFSDQTRVSIGFVFDNKSRVNEGAWVLDQVAGVVDSISADVGLSQPNILTRQEAANSLAMIRNGRGLSGSTVVFSGDLLALSIKVTRSPRNVNSSYQYENSQWKDADRQHDAAERQYKDCRKQYGEINCGNLKSDWDRALAYRKSLQHYLTQNYSYHETYIRVQGNMRMSFLYTDSITRGIKSSESLETAVGLECIEREGVHEKDGTARNSICNISDEVTYMRQMTDDIRNKALITASSQLVSLPFGYYQRARANATSINKQKAMEDYIRFLFLTKEKNGAEAQEARRSLAAYDVDLTTDGLLR